MKDLAIYGAGGFGREVACLVNEINQAAPEPLWKIIGFFDDGKLIGEKNEYGSILGGINELNNFESPLSVVLTIGNSATLESLVKKIVNPGISFPNIIAPDIRYLDINNMKMGKGNIFFSKCSLSCNVHIGDFNIFNSCIAVGHDVTIGSYNLMMPGTRISGEVNVGNLNFFGIYSVVLQQNSIGDNTVIGAGSVIMRNTKDNTTYVGNPAKKLHF
jgi:sugar O-acyltransferase (sialic acid O-acetyltransferase NeuD family)